MAGQPGFFDGDDRLKALSAAGDPLERRPRLTTAEKDTLKAGGTPATWTPARQAQIDRDGRWTIKRGRKRKRPPANHRLIADKEQLEIAVPVFGSKNHVGIDRAYGFLRRYSVTHAAAYDGGQLGAVLDGDNTARAVWADTAYRSAKNLAYPITYAQVRASAASEPKSFPG
jgi:hypothetical protein